MKLKTEEEILEFVDDALSRAQTNTDDWRAEAKTLYDYCAGYQWSVEESAALQENGKMAVTYNRMDPFLDAVTGMEALNRQECKYIAREVGKVGHTDVLNAAAKWAREACDAEDEETEAFRDTLICGMGWTNTRLEMDTDPDGMLQVERVDPLEMYWDPLARKKNLADARFVLRVQSVDKSVIADTWPEEENTDSTPVPVDKPHVVNASQAWKYLEDYSAEADVNRRQYIELQWFELQKVWIVKFPQGEQRLSAEQWKMQKDFILANGYGFTSTTQRAYRRAFVVGRSVKEIQDCPCTESFTYKAITGKRDRKNNTWYGVARAMKSPQQWANKFFSQVLFEIVTSGKGIIAEVDAFDDPRKAQEAWAAADDIVWAKPGANASGKIMPKPASQIHPGTDRLMQYSISAFRDVTGINLEMMGLADRQQPGIVEAQRKQAGLTIVAWAFDALRRYRKDQGRLLAYMIREYVADGRLLRLMGPDGQKYVPLIRDDLAFKYDVAADDAPSSPSMRERTWEVLLQLVPTMQQMGFPVPREVIEYVPLPESLVEKWKQQMNPKPTPEQQAQQQLQMRAMQADVAKKEGDAALANAKAKAESANIQIEAAKLQHAQQKTQVDAAKMQLDQRRAAVEERASTVQNVKHLADARKTSAETGAIIGGSNNEHPQ